MSYKNVINANADMLSKAEQMYQADQKNIALSKGSDVDDVEKQESLKAINDKLNILREEKAKALAEREREYNRDTKILQAIYDNDTKSNVVLKKQDKELEHNYDTIDNMKGDILTLRRQVEISQDETVRRNNRLFLLKLVFVYLLVSIIPVMLIKNDNISQNNGLIVIGAFTGLFMVSVLWNFYQNRNRNNLRYTVRQWDSPDIKDIISEEDNMESTVTEDKPQIDQLVDELTAMKEQALRDEDYETAANCKKMLEDIQNNQSNGLELGGYSNDDEVLKVLEEIKAEKNRITGDTETKRSDLIAKLEADIKSHVNSIKSLNTEITTSNETEQDLQNRVKESQNTIDQMTKELEKLKSA